MVCIAFGSHAPVDVIVLWRVVGRFVSLVAIAEASAASTLTATVVVGNNVTLAVCGVFAGSNPGDRGWLRAGRARGSGAATATAEKPINRAITPVFAALWITYFMESCTTRPCNGQYRNQRCAHQKLTKPRDKSTAGKPSC